MVDTFSKLETWKKSIELATEIYRISKEFPENELYGMTPQLRRAAVSISSNIAEGSGLSYNKKKLNHFNTASGSCNEVENLVIIANKLGYIEDNCKDELKELVSSTRRPLSGLIKYTENKIENTES